ncbi:MAG: DUF3187 family protein [bacterium]|nr:DUF3187 family protein [bacterium]
MRVGWVALAAILLWSAALADDGVVNPTSAQHLGPEDGYEDSVGAVDEISSYPDHPAPLPPSGKRSHAASIDELAGDTDFSLHDCDCCCTKCGGVQFFGPLPLTNTHPPMQMFLSPTPDSAVMLEDGAGFYSVDLDVSTIIIRELDSGVIADYDLETWRLTASYRQGMGDGEVFASLPLISRGAGVMDSVIRGWHGMFSLPNALRDTLPDNQYHYVIVTRDGPVLNGSPGSGLGDLTVGYKMKLWDRGDGKDAAALRAAVKLPTGDSGQYYSSGAIDVMVGALYQRQVSARMRSYFNLDYVVIGEPDLQNIDRQDIGSLMFATEYALGRSTTMQAMYQALGNPLRIGSGEADKSTQQLSAGIAHRIGRGAVWSGSFSEDIYPETAPDFVLSTGIRWEF